MKYIYIIFAVFILATVLSCDKNNDDESNKYPRCFQIIIDEILENPPTENRASISLYSYNNENVYVVFNPPSNGAADFESSVRDSDCNVVCSLGGIDGEPSPECSDFNNNSVLIEIVWTDSR